MGSAKFQKPVDTCKQSEAMEVFALLGTCANFGLFYI